MRLILDIQKAEGINGSGITELIKARNENVNRVEKLFLIGANSRIQQMINISGLDKYFPIVVSEADAIQLFDQQGPDVPINSAPLCFQFWYDIQTLGGVHEE